MRFIGEFVVVRTYRAGVHMGTLAEFSGSHVVLTAARRLWRWRGANTLHEVATRGVGPGSRISEPVEAIALTDAIEVIRCTPAAKTNLERSRWDA